MPLDGLRAWIGQVERKLGMRTRVFLVLSVIAIGGAGAAIYLAIDAQNHSVSESDVQELQRELEARIGSGGTTAGRGAELAQVETEVAGLKAEVEELQGKGGGSGGGGGASGSGGGGSEGGGGSGGASGSGSGGGASSGGGSGGGGGSGASTGTAPPSGAGSGRIGELIQKTKERAEKAEGK
jgi:hypothetical protein